VIEKDVSEVPIGGGKLRKSLSPKGGGVVGWHPDGCGETTEGRREETQCQCLLNATE